MCKKKLCIKNKQDFLSLLTFKQILIKFTFILFHIIIKIYIILIFIKFFHKYILGRWNRDLNSKLFNLIQGIISTR